MKIMTSLIAASLAVAASAASAVTVQWADLTAQPDATTVVGNIGSVGVTYSGAINFTQTNGGTDYWITNGVGVVGNVPFTLPTSYTQGIVNRPVGTDLISLNAGGTKTITFDSPVNDVYLAFTSWNTVNVSFDAPFTVVSNGVGFWGGGSFGNLTSNSFTGVGETHGVIKFSGRFTSLSFTDTDENWHGFTVGIGSAVVPEPQSWALLIAGFGLVGAAMRRRRPLAA